jgi:hypothetical protein
VIQTQTFADRLFVIVGTFDDLAAASIAGPVHYRRSVYRVVPTAIETGAPAEQSPKRNVLGDLDHQRGIESCALLGKHCIEGFGLVEAAREAVQQESILAIGSRKTIADDLDRQLVGHEPSAVDVFAHLEAERRSGGLGRAEDLAGRDRGDPILLGDPLGLGSFTGALRAKDDYAHRGATATSGNLRSDASSVAIRSASWSRGSHLP